MKISKDMMVADVLALNENLAPVFYEHGLFCLGCAMAHGESLEQACTVHGLDLQSLMSDLEKALAEDEVG